MRPVSLKTKITTPKLAETRDFYTVLFGLEVLEAWDEPGDAGVILGFTREPGARGRGEAYLEIRRAERAADFSGLSLQFRVPDVAAFKAFVAGRAPVAGPTRRPWGSSYLFMTDPNGVSVVVFENAEGGL